MIESSERLGRHRWAGALWAGERTFAGLNQMKRPVIRYERRDDIHDAFFRVGCCLVRLGPAPSRDRQPDTG